MAEFQPLPHGYVMAIHGNLKANHDMVISCFAKARPSSHGRQL
jgi:hypothetical protein